MRVVLHVPKHGRLDLIRVRAGCFLFSPAAWAGGQMLAYSSPHNSLSLSLLWAAILLAAG